MQRWVQQLVEDKNQSSPDFVWIWRFFQKLQKMIFFSKPFLFNQLEFHELKYLALLKIKKINIWKSFSLDKEKFFFFGCRCQS